MSNPTGNLGDVLVIAAQFVAISIYLSILLTVLIFDVSMTTIQERRKEEISKLCYFCRLCRMIFVRLFLLQSVLVGVQHCG